MNLFNLLKSKKFGKLLDKALDEQMFKTKSKGEIYSEIVNYYFLLLRKLSIDSFHSFHFPDYEDCRKVEVDGKEYDFENKFSHNDSDATEALCAIDCLITDLEANSIETVLKEIEDNLNSQNRREN
jgi:carbonic anhydrase